VLIKLQVRNFKKFGNVEIELGNPVVFVGPNNSGKSTALQALALWNIGLQRWMEKRGSSAPGKRPGVTINRRDLMAVPVPEANLLWRDLGVRELEKENGKPHTQNIRIDIKVSGVTNDKEWECGFEFDYANKESFYCRPLRLSEDKDAKRMIVPEEALSTKVAYLPPMSGLADREFRRDEGEINFLIGQGKTAEVLRNLALLLHEKQPAEWDKIKTQIKVLFGDELDDPGYISERGEINLAYRNRSGAILDLSSSGRGLQQTLLILTYMVVHKGSVLLLDEPDAHLEILRQRENYQLITDIARKHSSQIIAASHSEVLLNEAADRDVVIAFVGTPHRIDDRGRQVLKALKEIGFEHYYQAELRGWILYVEGSTDLAILRSFAEKLEHPAQGFLASPFVHYIFNQPSKARDHFYGIREAKNDLVGFVLVDRIEGSLQNRPELVERMWRRKEIENYLCQPQTLMDYAEDSASGQGPLFEQPAERDRRKAAMEACINDLVPPVALRNQDDQWWFNVKASDEFLDRLFASFFERLQLPNLMRKTDYHTLARYVRREDIAAEVVEVLDAVVSVGQRARLAVSG
jgi:predicted ATPase